MAVTETLRRLQGVVADCGLPFVEIEAGGTAGSHLEFSWAENESGVAPGAHLCLVASITKPVVATMAMQLVAEGHLSLSERITDRLPELPPAEFRRITVRHLLTHTCGLPDQLPGNAQLRAAHADLDVFVQEITAHGTEYTPGTDCRYSSMGILLLAKVMSRIADRPLPQLLQEELFVPAGMNDTWLGVPQGRDDIFSRALPSVLPRWQSDGSDWDWNSHYWRHLGAPWGGLLSTVVDLGRFCRLLLRGGKNEDGKSVVQSATIQTMLANQSQRLFDLPDSVWGRRSWGYGWRMQWPCHSASFGDLVPATAAGHWGDTGTLLWLNPENQTYAVILTNTPFETSRIAIQRLSNVVAAALAE